MKVLRVTHVCTCKSIEYLGEEDFIVARVNRLCKGRSWSPRPLLCRWPTSQTSILTALLCLDVRDAFCVRQTCQRMNLPLKQS